MEILEDNSFKTNFHSAKYGPMNKQKFFPYARQSINEDDRKAVLEALSQDLITRGPKTKEFEERIAEYVGAKWAVAFNSGSSALYASCFAANAGPADRCITTPNSFIATVGAAMRYGVRPTFVDIDRNSGNLDLQKLPEALETSRSRGNCIIMPVHFSGIAQDMQKLDRLIKTPNVVIIEDAAHAIGSCYPSGEKVGSCAYSQITIFSFHPAKTITCAEGGMVTTSDPTLYHRLLLYRNSALEREKPYIQKEHAPWYYEAVDLTGNFHMTEMQAALGLSQLHRIDQFIEKRKRLISLYREHLEGTPHIRLFSKEHDTKTCSHLFVVQFDFQALKTTRTEFMHKLHEHGIGSQLHYIPLYRHPILEKIIGDKTEQFPEMEAYYAQALSLPLYYDLQEEDIVYIASTIKKLIL